MKKLFLSIIIATGVCGCGPSPVNNTKHVGGSAVVTATNLLLEETDAGTIFAKADAEKILGEPATLKEFSNTTGSDTTIFKSTYTAITADKKTGKTGNVYFMFEEYNNDKIAHDLLAYYQAANKDNGAQPVAGFGDEAWFHTDKQNFYFLMARKGNKMIRLKVNKTTANTSLEAFNAVAKEVVGKM